jgi:hypothetical protein
MFRELGTFHFWTGDRSDCSIKRWQKGRPVQGTIPKLRSSRLGRYTERCKYMSLGKGKKTHSALHM